MSVSLTSVTTNSCKSQNQRRSKPRLTNCCEHMPPLLFQMQGLISDNSNISQRYEAALFECSCLAFKLPSISLLQHVRFGLAKDYSKQKKEIGKTRVCLPLVSSNGVTLWQLVRQLKKRCCSWRLLNARRSHRGTQETVQEAVVRGQLPRRYTAAHSWCWGAHLKVKLADAALYHHAHVLVARQWQIPARVRVMNRKTQSVGMRARTCWARRDTAKTARPPRTRAARRRGRTRTA